MAIPKIIHYCWFGNKPIPELEAKYISGWKKKLHDYEFKLWNEHNFNIDSTKFTKQVASVYKWGFIVDYIRAYAVFNCGGIYLDTDVEIIKKFDDLLDAACFVGFEEVGKVNPGSAFGGEKGCKIALEIMNFYENYDFIKEDGSLNLTPSPKILSSILLKYGFKQNDMYQKLPEITIYPCEYFTPKSFKTGRTKITENTYSIHHFAGSWVPEEKQELIHERWDFHKKYGDDEYLVGLYEQVKEHRKKNVDFISLKKLYRIAIKRTFSKLLGKTKNNG